MESNNSFYQSKPHITNNNASSSLSDPDSEHSLIQNYEDFYNGIALGILITGILILAFIIVNTWTDENGVSRGVRTAEDRDDLRRMSSDPPPSYVETVCRADPPAYKESLMQQELNPEVNLEWANRQASGNLDKEIQEVVLQRVNSCTHGKLYSLIIQEESRSEGSSSSSGTSRRGSNESNNSTSTRTGPRIPYALQL
ncbi:unnamed protein product [Lepeophtheirus salmonis]|uniref:(salmon louse) hypothetical protein n=1 Tax=Lepeophtheirus salmonis TaxID=72036 RepID=A0A7R8HCP2_LEPSM|nr:unnamed protein product [Lepeophtheirus salmonis]CAF3008638.1 unnamed protein product [Lepeophtheirus salmonis]